MIDIHCHVLPGVDDGPDSWDVAVAMCHIARQDGITHIVATPHANGRFKYDRLSHLQRLNELRRRVPDMEFSLGCDFHLSQESIEKAIANPSYYTIGETNYILVEFSDFYTPQQMIAALCRLQSAELFAVITHPERNPVIAKYPELPLQFARMGSLLQVTADSMTGAWGSAAKKCSHRLLKSGLVSAIATDAHENRNRKPILSSACRAAVRLVGDSLAHRLFEQNPRAIINNLSLAA